MEECPIDRAFPENFDVRAHEDVFFRKDGSTFDVAYAASPIFKAGKPVGTVIEIRPSKSGRHRNASKANNRLFFWPDLRKSSNAGSMPFSMWRQLAQAWRTPTESFFLSNGPTRSYGDRICSSPRTWTSTGNSRDGGPTVRRTTAGCYVPKNGHWRAL